MTDVNYRSILDLKKLHEEELKKNPQDEEDDDQNFIRKDQPQEEQENQEEKSEEETVENPQGFFGKLKNKIFPKANQNRTLDNEVGGLEAEEQKDSLEKDAWDGRSEEVDKMGSTNVFESSGMRSVVWKQKKARLDAKKIAKEAVGAKEAHDQAAKTSQQGIGSSFDNQGFAARLKNLRQDRTDTFGKGGGGRGL